MLHLLPKPFPLIGLQPYTSRPDSVSVPVLSNPQIVTIPPTLTLSGLIQSIYLSDRRLMASEIPAPSAVGSAGGTQIVITSNPRIIALYSVNP